MPLITLLTDFGTADGYVAEMKGVLLSIVRDAWVVDLAHDIPPQDVEQARGLRADRRHPVGPGPFANLREQRVFGTVQQRQVTCNGRVNKLGHFSNSTSRIAAAPAASRIPLAAQEPVGTP
jgi:hypothetical protein